MAPLIISIEGNIGSGKSTLLKNLQEKFQDKNYVFVKEPVDLWEHVTDEEGITILENFYKEPTKYSFAFQMMAFTTRMSVLKEAVSENPDAEVIICERSIEADRHVFAQMLYDDKLMNKMEYKIYTDLAKEYIDDNPIDAIVYFYTTSEKCIERIIKRSRTGESNIESAYLAKCEVYHNRWLSGDLNKEEGPNWEGIVTGNESPPILNILGNHDIEYNLNDSTNQGSKWISYVNDLIHNLQHNEVAHFPIE
jgi:deoxyadenosine/deoxycytidine kinase